MSALSANLKKYVGKFLPAKKSSKTVAKNLKTTSKKTAGTAKKVTATKVASKSTKPVASKKIADKKIKSAKATSSSVKKDLKPTKPVKVLKPIKPKVSANKRKALAAETKKKLGIKDSGQRNKKIGTLKENNTVVINPVKPNEVKDLLGSGKLRGFITEAELLKVFPYAEEYLDIYDEFLDELL